MQCPCTSFSVTLSLLFPRFLYVQMDLVFPFLTSPSLYFPAAFSPRLFSCFRFLSARLRPGALGRAASAPPAPGKSRRPRASPPGAPRCAIGRSGAGTLSEAGARAAATRQSADQAAARRAPGWLWPGPGDRQRGRPATHTHKPQAPTQWDSARRHRPRTTQAHRASQPNPATNTEINKCHAQPQTYTYTTLTEHRYNGHIRDHSTHTPTSTHMITRCKHT